MAPQSSDMPAMVARLEERLGGIGARMLEFMAEVRAADAERKADLHRLTETDNHRMDKLQQQMERLADKIDHMESRMDAASGGWRLAVLLGMPAAIGSAITAGLVAWFKR